MVQIWAWEAAAALTLLAFILQAILEGVGGIQKPSRIEGIPVNSAR